MYCKANGKVTNVVSRVSLTPSYTATIGDGYSIYIFTSPFLMLGKVTFD